MPRTYTSDLTSQAVGEEIRKTRRVLGISQAELARRMDAKAPYVAAIESGNENLTLGGLARVADALGSELQIGFPLPKVDWPRVSEELKRASSSQ